MNDHPAVYDVKSLPATVGFQDRNYLYKSVATYNHHDSRLAPISCTGRKFLHLRGCKQPIACTSSKQNALDCVTNNSGFNILKFS